MRTRSPLLALSLLVATAACVEAPTDGPADRAPPAAPLVDPSITAADDLASRMSYTLDAWEQDASAPGDATPPAPDAAARQVVCRTLESAELCCVGMYCCWFFSAGEPICF
ncbi:MAG: hypothetical protein IPH44_05170 [Myxococcales bacterium]|jgi:hypothetical protein|nr:hypothetical protein [Myxococcales bacterium]MBK7193650.1 hypothetical protein [Myxococcales bacterium]MBP6845555.1 hypothetical protein [Kofleriaceae bacterium]